MNAALKPTNLSNPAALSLTGLSPEERIAALADSALSEADAQSVIDELLRSSELCASWQSLHRCGDYLRSEDLTACDANGAFWNSFSARLEQEPTLLAPKSDAAPFARRRLWMRYGVPGAAVAAALMVSWMTLPQLTGTSAPVQVAARLDPSTATTSSAAVDTNKAMTTAQAEPSTLSTSSTAQGLVALGSGPSSAALETVAAKPVDARQLRNYLAAHQQFSASALRGPVAVQSASFNIIRAED